MGKHTKRHRMKTTYFYDFAVRETRPGYYIADRQVNGHRMRKGFSDLAQAKFWCQQKQIEIENHGIQSVKISDAQRVELNKLHKMLDGRSVTITDCVEFWLKKNPDTTSGETWSDTTDRYLKSMEDAGRRKASLTDKRLKLGVLSEEMGTVLMSTIDNNDLSLALDKITGARDWTPDTRHAYENAGKTLIRFYGGLGKRMKKQDDSKQPETWNADFTKKLLTTAESVTPEIVAGLAVMMFAGLRPTEAQRLEWSQIDFNEKLIHLHQSQTKTRRARNVEMSDNLIRWLNTYQGGGRLMPSASQYRVQREALMKAVQLEKWVPDTPRHTAATFMYALRNADYVSRNLGHSIGVMFKHYQGTPPTPKELKKFWNILPKGTQQ